MPDTKGSFILQMFAECLLRVWGGRRKQDDKVSVPLGLTCLEERQTRKQVNRCTQTAWGEAELQGKLIRSSSLQGTDRQGRWG